MQRRWQVFACGATVVMIAGLGASACLSSTGPPVTNSEPDGNITLPGEDGATPPTDGSVASDGSSPVDASHDAITNDAHGDAGAPSADAAPVTCPLDAGLAPCAQQPWSVLVTGGSACVTSSGLVLVGAVAATNNLLTVSQGGLDGDFTLTVDFDSIAGSEGEFEVGVTGGTTTGGVSAGFFPPSSILAEYNETDGGYLAENQPATGTSGTVVVSRSGTTSTVTITVGTSHATANGTVALGPVYVYLSASGYTTSSTSVVVTSAIATSDAGTFVSETFGTCNALQ